MTTSFFQESERFYVQPKEIKPYEHADAKGCFLTNVLAIVPHHAILPDDDVRFDFEDADFAIIAINKQEEGLLPLEVQFPAAKKEPFVVNKEFQVHKFGESKYLFHASRKVGFEPGDSGTVICGRSRPVQDERNTRSEVYVHLFTPLFLIVARSRANACNAIAISIPALANGGLNRNFMKLIEEEVRSLVLEDHANWELISTFGEVKRAVKLQFSKMQPKKLSVKYDEQSLDGKFVTHLLATKKYEYLMHAFVVAKECGENKHDQCWIVLEERDKSHGSSNTSYFFNVANAIEEFGFSNMESDDAMTTLYKNSSIPVKISNGVVAKFHGEITRCHHPFICETNPDCRGKVMRNRKKQDGTVTSAPYLSHCCIRPSHLVKAKKDFNALCTILSDFGSSGIISWGK
jgi:hypothetical protein